MLGQVTFNPRKMKFFVVRFPPRFLDSGGGKFFFSSMDEIETYLGPISTVGMKRKGTSKGGRAKRARISKSEFAAFASMAPRRASARPMRVGELKGMDTTFDIAEGALVATTNTNANTFVLNLIQSGTGSWNRVGKKAYLKSVRCRARCVMLVDRAAGTGNIEGGTLRYLVVWDKQPSGGAIPAFDVMFGRTDQAGTESCQYLDGLRYDNTDRFSVLRDGIVTLNPQLDNAAAVAGDATRYEFQMDEFIKLGGRECQFSGQTSPMTIADVSSGALYLIFRADKVSASQAWSVAQSVARLRYTD